MNAILGKSGQRIEVDVIVLDKEDRPVLLVEAKAKANVSQDEVFRFLGQFEVSEFPFAMFADFSRIAIFGKDLADPRTPICGIETVAVLSLYEPAFGQKRIFPDYFEALIEAWLRDFAFHWKSVRPPASKELEAIGLAQRLSGGMTYKGAFFDGPALYRD
jgi:hypothetical protein